MGKHGWIPVSERVPDEHINVLIAFPSGLQATACRYGDEWYFTGDQVCLEDTPTHWKPLGPPPSKSWRENAAAATGG